MTATSGTSNLPTIEGDRMNLYYQDQSVTLYQGDALDVLRTMEDRSVNCCVTSPPYYGLRDYGDDRQYGLEDSPTDYVETMRAVFAEVRRVLSDDGTLWLNIGDSYASDSKWGGSTGDKHVKPLHGNTSVGRAKRFTGLPDKNLIGIPWRTAFALQEDGWILRNAIVWAKPNAMPESVTDRVSSRHELIFLFSKSRRYWFDLDPIREPTVYPPDARALSFARDTKEADIPGQASRQHRSSRTHGRAAGTNLSPSGMRHSAQDDRGRNPGDVWTIPTQPFRESHFAVFPVEIPRRAIASGCKPGGTVLDPFSGSGTSGLAAGQLGCRYVGIDLNPDYLDLSLRTRLVQTSLVDEAQVIA